jgi:hypothetical protein
MQRFDLKKLNDAEFKKWYQVKFSNMFANLEDNVDINMAWGSIRI